MNQTNPQKDGTGPDRRHLIGGAVVVSLGLAGGYTIGRRAGEGDDAAPVPDEATAKLYDVDPALIRYEVTRTLPLNLPEAHAMAALPGGGMVLAGAQSVLIDARGNRIAELDAPGRSRAVTRAADGSVWVATTRQVTEHDAAGQRLAAWPIPVDEALITGIAVSDEHVYLADAHHRIVHQCDRAGRLVRDIENTTDGAKGFVVPSPYFDLNLDAAGDLWVANPGRHRVERFSPDGRFIDGWGATSNALEGFCGCCNPCSFALLPDGRFITAEKGIARVKRYTRDGRFDAVVAAPALFTGELTGGRTLRCQGKALVVAAAESGTVHVLDPAASRIHVLTEKTDA